MPPSILVIGAGELGDAVLRALASHPARSATKIDLLIRPASINSTDASKQETLASLKALNITPVAGDIVTDSEHSLAATCSAYDTLVSCAGMAQPAGTQLRIARAVLASACRRFFPWQYGIDYDVVGAESAQELFAEQLTVRALLRAQSRLRWVVVSTGLFMSFLFEPAFGVVSARRDAVVALGAWGNRVTATAVRDVGRVVAEVVLVRADVEGVVFVAGETVAMWEVVGVVERGLGRRVRREVKSVGVLREELARDPRDAIKKYRVVFAEGRGE